MKEIVDFVDISKYAGERFDLIQAGGGNSSVKLENGEMIIKASGFILSDMAENKGYSRVDIKKTVKIATTKSVIKENDKRKRESIAANLIKEATLDKKNRPSIETLLHSFLYKYTLHTHPIVVNMVVMQKDWKKILSTIFQNEDIALIKYKTPGIELALELHTNLQSFEVTPNIIFLQNHGLIITSSNKDDIRKLTESVLQKIESYLEIDMSKFKLPNDISSLVGLVEKNSKLIAYQSEDKYLNNTLSNNPSLYSKTPFCPDSLVFCGVSPVEIENIMDVEPIRKYKEKFYEMPKILLFQKKVFFLAENIRKAKEMEEVMKFHIFVLEKTINKNNNFLELDELAYLSNWEAERFRQKI